MGSDAHEQFMRLWVQYQMHAYAYIRALVPDRAAADDVLQEVAAVAWRKFDEFEEGTRFDRWINTIAYHQVLYYRRKLQRDLLVFSEEILGQLAQEMSEERQSSSDYLAALESCLFKLSTAERNLVRKRMESGATNRSVAKDVGRSESTVSRMLDRIYLALMHCIQTKLAVGGLGANP